MLSQLTWVQSSVLCEVSRAHANAVASWANIEITEQADTDGRQHNKKRAALIN